MLQGCEGLRWSDHGPLSIGTFRTFLFLLAFTSRHSKHWVRQVAQQHVPCDSSLPHNGEDVRSSHVTQLQRYRSERAHIAVWHALTYVPIWELWARGICHLPTWAMTMGVLLQTLSDAVMNIMKLSSVSLPLNIRRDDCSV